MELGRLWKPSMPEIKVYRRKTGTQSIRTQRFYQENLKARDINYGMIAHGNDKGRNMAIHDVIARLCYCHRAELSMQMHGRIEWQNAEGASVSEGCSFNIAGTSPGSGILHQEVQEGPAEAVFGKEVFREETQEPEAEVAKLEEQNLVIREIRQELKDSRNMVHAKDVETQKFGTQHQKY